MSIRATFASAAILSAAAGMATAQDWSGSYAGAQLGLGKTDLSGFVTPLPFIRYSGDGSFGSNLIGGAFAGYNWQPTPNVVLGGEVDIALGTIEGRGTAVGGPTEIFTHSYSRTVALRLRAGYAVQEFLPYFAVGMVSSEFEFTTGGTLTPNTRSDRINGVTYGVGLDWSRPEDRFLRIELRETEYDDQSYTGLSGGIFPITSSDLSTREVRVGYGMNF